MTPPLVLWVPGAIVNPGGPGWTWLKRARLARPIRERDSQHLLLACGRTPPWPVHTPKRVTFRGYVRNRFDDDRFPYAVAPYRDGLMDCGMFSTPATVKRGKRAGLVARGTGDGPAKGHRFVYEQVVSRGKQAKVGVEIVVELAAGGAG